MSLCAPEVDKPSCAERGVGGALRELVIGDVFGASASSEAVQGYQYAHPADDVLYVDSGGDGPVAGHGECVGQAHLIGYRRVLQPGAGARGS